MGQVYHFNRRNLSPMRVPCQCCIAILSALAYAGLSGLTGAMAFDRISYVSDSCQDMLTVSQESKDPELEGGGSHMSCVVAKVIKTLESSIHD